MKANRWSRHTALQRFWMKVELDPSGCWIWTGSRSAAGYGRFWPAKGQLVQAHRWLYEQLVGPVPAALDLDHFACENHACVRPDHVRPATRRENLLRGDTLPARNLARDHCPAGHAYTPENTYVRPHGGRDCRECKRESDRRRYARKS